MLYEDRATRSWLLDELEVCAMDSKTSLGAGVRPLQGGGGIFKSAAVAVLRMERRLMTTGEITKVALEKALINCQGRTPDATMASALYTDVKRKLDNSVFTRPQEGLFGLREWEDQGFIPEPALALPSPTVTPLVPMLNKRLRSSSTRAIKKPERFAGGDFEDIDEVLSRSTPSPLLHLEHHTGAGSLNSPEGSLQLMGFAEVPHLESGCAPLSDPNKSGSSNGWKEVEASASNRSTLSGGEEAQLRQVQVQLQLEVPREGPWAASTESSPAAKYDRLAVLYDAALSPSRPTPEHTPQMALFVGERELAARSLAELADFADGEELRKRPRLTLDIPCQGALPSDLHISSGEHGIPIYAALHTPTFPLTHSAPPSRPLSPHVLGCSRPESAFRACRGAPLSSGQLTSCLGSASAALVLDTPSIMQMALPEGDLSFSPLLPFQQLLFTEEASEQPLEHSAFGAAAALRAHAPDRPIESDISQDPGQFAHTMPASLALPAPLHPLPWAQAPSVAAEDVSATASASVVGGPPPTWERLKQMEEDVHRQEALLGKNHPQVGKQWLYLSRAYQNEDPQQYSEKAERALVRAWKICSSCFNKCRKPPPCDAPFDFLLSRIRTTTTHVAQSELGGLSAMIPVQQAGQGAGDYMQAAGNSLTLPGESVHAAGNSFALPQFCPDFPQGI